MRWRRKIFFPTLLTLLTASTLAAQEKPKSLLGGLEASLPIEALHQVQPTDNLHLLAAYYYRDARQWRRIFDANRGAIKNPNLIYIDQILRIPLSPGWSVKEPYSGWKARVQPLASSRDLRR